MNNALNWKPDESQQAVIVAHGGYHLVLAPPGCGKTQILTERVRQAHQLGRPYSDMLCLTFTNRAARGMQERISENIADEDVSDLYVGNVHRFCSKFLYENNVMEAETSIIDDDDAVSILARYLDEEEDKVKADYNLKHGYEQIIQFSHLMHQIAHHYPRDLRLHPDSLNSDDIAAMKFICKVEKRPFDAVAMLDIYEHNDYYRDAIRSDAYAIGIQQMAQKLLHKMRFAHAFTAYMRQNKLMDFEDLLLFTYDAMNGEGQFKCYPWIQVDEVQDLNPLQIAILDRISTIDSAAPSDEQGEILYLGDEQQAIFSFMGAKMDTLSQLKMRCQNHIHHLNVNHRSPGYLLQVFNQYATDVLLIDKELLPTTPNNDKSTGRELKILYSNTLEEEYGDVAQFAANLYREYPFDTTAVIVSANKDADEISQSLHDLGLPHFKISGIDLFSTPEVKLLLAHLNVLCNENNFIAWARLLKGLNVFQTNAAARDFMRKLFNRAILPSDFLLYDDSTYVQDFVETYENEEIVLFDTETTGLNIFEDDVLQIAAIKVKGGQKVAGSDFCVYLETEREIPPKLGDMVNPIIEERKHHPILPNGEALRLFLAYAGDDVLMGHNVAFDVHIMDFNLRRYLKAGDYQPKYFDTLKLLRLLEPNLHSYKLDDFRLRHLFGIQEDEAHLANVDVLDTLKVAVHCYQKAREILPSQMEFLSRQNVQSRFEILRKNYLELYFHSKNLLYERDFVASEPVLVSEMRGVYQRLVENQQMMPVEKLDYLLEYLSHDVLHPAVERSLMEQLQAHIMEINTLKEADLCNSSTLRDRVFVTTVHKAKGLEFDNVIVFDAVDGRYPNYYNQGLPRLLDEDKRKLYVALSRAKRRLFVSQSMVRFDYHKQPHERQLSPFMKPILKYFN